MNISDIVSVSGLGGLYRVAGNRSNGMIIEDLDSGKKRFVSARKHQFSPLESIGIYVQNGETLPIAKVFARMREQAEDNPPPTGKVDNKAYREYFLDVLPDHDEDRVKINDIKKLSKWYGYLNERGYLEEETEATEAVPESAPDAAAESTEDNAE